MIFFYVGTFLLPSFLPELQDPHNGLPPEAVSFFVGEITFLLLFIPVELICGKTYDQIISKLSGTTQKIDMPIMKQVESSVCDYSFHN